MLDKKISFSGFDLESSEQQKVNELIERYLRKIEDRLSDYEDIKLRLRKSKHGKAFLHEVEGDIVVKGKILTSRCTDYNLYTAISKVFEKMLREIEHIRRLPKEIK